MCRLNRSVGFMMVRFLYVPVKILRLIARAMYKWKNPLDKFSIG